MIHSVGFVGVRTEAFAAMTALFFDRGPVVGLVVDDFDRARAAMIDAGIEFIGELQREGGSAWNHYRAPDGNVYEIIGPDRAGSEPAAGS